MIGDNIKKLRTEHGMTQKDLADKLFVTAQAVSRWENGDVEPSISTVASMAKIFNVSGDQILGIEGFNKEPEIIVEKEYVYKDPIKPVLGVCESCNIPIYEAKEIVRKTHHIYCKDCESKMITQVKQNRINKSISKRKKSFWVGGIISGLWIAMTIYVGISEGDNSFILPNVILGIVVFTFISCFILQNNFIREMTLSIFSFGFVKMPGLIFTLDLDGIIWLITVKLFLWLLGIFLACLFGLIAVFIGAILSVFVYPFAIAKNFKYPELIDL